MKNNSTYIPVFHFDGSYEECRIPCLFLSGQAIIGQWVLRWHLDNMSCHHYQTNPTKSVLHLLF